MEPRQSDGVPKENRDSGWRDYPFCERLCDDGFATSECAIAWAILSRGNVGIACTKCSPKGAPRGSESGNRTDQFRWGEKKNPLPMKRMGLL